MAKVFLVSCVGMKIDGPARAKDLYCSDWFIKARTYVESHYQDGDAVYILSAEYGLLEWDAIIKSYDKTLVSMAKMDRFHWSSKVLAELVTRHDPDGLEIEILAGEKYREFLVPGLESFGGLVSVPMKGLGIGKQKAWLMYYKKRGW